MNNRVGRVCVVLAAMGGCAAPSAPQAQPREKPFALAASGDAAPTGEAAPVGRTELSAAADSPYAADRVIASIKDGRFERQITMDQVLKPLVEAHGLNTLLIVVQLELAKGLAERAGVRVSHEDIARERETTFGRLFQENDERLDKLIDQANRAKKKELAEKYQKQKLEDRELLLKQFLEQQRIAPSELDLVFTTNVYLRKLAEPQVANQIKEEDLQREFSIRYNEQVRARHIQLDRAQDVHEAKRRLDAGEPFEKVAREMSTNQATAALNGELPPFSREDTRLPQNFKDVAFSLKDGQVSDAVEAGGAYHIIKAEHRIAPKVIKYQDVKETLHRDLTERVTQAVITRIRADIGQIAREAMEIKDPVLKTQFKEKIASFNLQQAEAEQRAKEDLERERMKASATQPANSVAGPGVVGPKVGPAPVFGEPGAPQTQPSVATQPATTAPADANKPIPAVKPKDKAPAGKASKADRPGTPPAAATQPASPAKRPAGSPN